IAAKGQIAAEEVPRIRRCSTDGVEAQRVGIIEYAVGHSVVLDMQLAVAGIADTVAIFVVLLRVRRRVAVVASVAGQIVVGVGLIEIGNQRAVVGSVGDSVVVG